MRNEELKSEVRIRKVRCRGVGGGWLRGRGVGDMLRRRAVRDRFVAVADGSGCPWT
jgi:hypothetical protein